MWRQDGSQHNQEARLTYHLYRCFTQKQTARENNLKKNTAMQEIEWLKENNKYMILTTFFFIITRWPWPPWTSSENTSRKWRATPLKVRSIDSSFRWSKTDISSLIFCKTTLIKSLKTYQEYKVQHQKSIKIADSTKLSVIWGGVGVCLGMEDHKADSNVVIPHHLHPVQLAFSEVLLAAL